MKMDEGQTSTGTPDTAIPRRPLSDEERRKTTVAFDEITERATDCSALVEALSYKLKNKEMSTAEGMSFLELKNHLLLNYLVGISGVVLRKVAARSIQEGPFVDQLVELRTILEKMRPMDQKLKYQIEKLIRNAADGKSDSSDPLKHKANLDNLEDDSEGEESDEDVKAGASSKVYQPPKVAPLPYDDEEEAPAKQVEKTRKKSINRALIREMQEEFLDTPIEIHNGGDAFAMQLSRGAKDKQRFEETYMTRLPETKKDKHRANVMSTMGILGDEITDFRAKRTSRSSGGAGGGKGTKRKKSKSTGSVNKKFRKK